MFNVIAQFLDLKNKGYEPDEIIRLLEERGHDRKTVKAVMEILGYEVILWFGRPAVVLCPC